MDNLDTGKDKIKKICEILKSETIEPAKLEAHQASAQAMEGLRQSIENKLFNETLSDWIEQHTADPKVAADLISALVKAIEKEGTSVDFSALIPKAVPADKVNAYLGKEILEKLHEEGAISGDFIGGGQLKLHDRKLTLDLSDAAIRELLERYVRKEFHALLFQ